MLRKIGKRKTMYIQKLPVNDHLFSGTDGSDMLAEHYRQKTDF